MAHLTIFILCHNRPAYTRQAISSVLGQTSHRFTLTVSDNSSNDDVECMVISEFPDVHYIRRTPMLKVLDHLNCCIEETRSEYFCLFHDDDIMGSNFVEVMEKYTREFPLAIAIGCNAKVEKFRKLEKRTIFRSFRQIELIDSPLNLARRYFSRSQSGFAPFPGYVYNRHLIGDYRLPVGGGKYADVTWLLSLANKGTIIWVNTPLMTYRLHESNDGNIESLRDRLQLLGFLKQNLSLFGADLINDFRCSFIYKKIVKAYAGIHPKRHRLAITFLNHYRCSRYARLYTYKALVARVRIKWVAER